MGLADEVARQVFARRDFDAPADDADAAVNEMLVSDVHKAIVELERDGVIPARPPVARVIGARAANTIVAIAEAEEATPGFRADLNVVVNAVRASDRPLGWRATPGERGANTELEIREVLHAARDLDSSS